MARIAIMALEGMEEVVEPVEDTRIEVQDIVDQPENDIAEMQEIATEMAEGEAGLDEAVDTAGVMERVADNVEATIPEGGMPEAAAAAVEVAVEHMCLRLGFTSKHSGFSMEGFGDKATRVRSTMEALKDIKEFASKIWQAIVNFFSRAIQWVKSFFIKLTVSSKKLGTRADEIAKKATALNGKAAPADAKVDTGSFKKELCNNSLLLTGSGLVSSYAKMTKTTALKDIETISKDLGADLITLTNTTQMGAGDFNAKLSSVLSSFSKSAGAPSTDKEKAVEGMSLFSSRLSLGDKALYTLIVPATAPAEKVAELATKSKIYVDTVSGTKTPEVEKAEPLTAKEISELAELVSAHMNKINANESSIKAIEAIQGKVQDQAKKLAKDTSGDSSEARTSAIKAAAAATRMLVSLTTTALQQLAMHEIVTGKAALDYCSVSLKAIGEVEKEEKKA